MERVHVKVYGEVQAVGFRSFVVRIAKELRLAGWVKNNLDGGVEAVAEGPKDRLEELLRRMRKGPPAAKVKDVDVSWERPTGEFKDFRRLH